MDSRDGWDYEALGNLLDDVDLPTNYNFQTPVAPTAASKEESEPKKKRVTKRKLQSSNGVFLPPYPSQAEVQDGRNPEYELAALNKLVNHLKKKKDTPIVLYTSVCANKSVWESLTLAN